MTALARSSNDIELGPVEEIDIGVAHAARIHAYYLGEDAYFEVDRIAAEYAAAVHPGGIEVARASVRTHRAFQRRVVRWLVRKGGVRQFLVIGSGLPSGDSLHAVAQHVVPEVRMVYVDDDPVVLAHAHQQWGTSSKEGRVWCLRGDLRQPLPILASAADLLDFAKPVALLLAGDLHFLPEHRPFGVVSQLMEVASSSSYLALCQLAIDIHPAEMADVARRFSETTGRSWVLRTRDQVSGLFEHLELVEPGVVQIDQWRPEDQPVPVLPPDGSTIPLWVGVGRKP